jgi:hypothetical protein
MIEYVEAEYPGNYITSLFKNASRCSTLVDLVLADRASKVAAVANGAGAEPA